MAVRTQLILSFFFILLSFSTVALAEEGDCVYSLYVRTGSIIKGGTDSIIGLKLKDLDGNSVQISNLETWGGLMEPGHNYFERGIVDIFSGRGRCLASPACYMNLTSDGSGSGHEWYCNHVEVTTSGIHAPCSQQLFTVEQWLARDISPYSLSAVRNYCPVESPDDRKSRSTV